MLSADHCEERPGFFSPDPSVAPPLNLLGGSGHVNLSDHADGDTVLRSGGSLPYLR